MPGRVLSAYDASSEADDGLALAATLAELVGGEVMVARVFDGPTPKVLDRAFQLEKRAVMMETRAALGDLAAVELTTIADDRLARALHALADEEHASFLVFGSSHHQRLGRAILGASAEICLAGAGCPVAVAPPGLRDANGGLRTPDVSVAYDGSPTARRALALAVTLAQGGGGRLRIVGAAASLLHRPLPGTGERHVEAALAAVGDLPVPATTELVPGAPGDVLVEESRRTGLLVMGTHARGPVGRAVLGSVATHVLRRTDAPLVLCPPT